MSDRASRKTPEVLREEALGWIVRLRDSEAADWVAFEQWMAADLRAPAIYWALAETDADVADALSRPRPEISPSLMPARPPRRKWLAGGALAIAASILLLFFLAQPADTYGVATPAGVTRNLALGDGSAIFLDGGTTLELDRTDPRTVRLVSGAARFTVAHDAARPFRVQVGDAVLTDLGTIFAVTRREATLRVEVAEGAVRYRGDGRSHDLRAGDWLEIGPGGKQAEGRVDPADVASWAEGRLVYADAKAETVAADLGRATGLDVSVAPAAAGLRFSGGFALGNRDAGTIRRAADLMGLRVRASGERLVLEPGAAEPQ